MIGRVVLFGATGYTGRLTAEAMSRAGLAPVLAGRSAQRLVDLVAELAPLAPIDAAPTWQWADVAEPASVRALVSDRADVLVSTVGPFMDLGLPALDAAIDQGCGYVDSTGEPPFVRDVFETAGPRAAASGARLLTAFGYDYVPGNLAGALAIRDAHERGRSPDRVDIGYFVRGGLQMSSGTRATSVRMLTAPSYAWRGGRMGAPRRDVMAFDVDGRRVDAMPIGGSEHFALPRRDAHLLDIGVYLGWAGRWSRAVTLGGGLVSTAVAVPGLSGLLRRGLERIGGRETGAGPTPQERRGSDTVAVARAIDGVGRQISRVVVEGPSPYDLTAELLAWAAAMLATGRGLGTGALGPADAFGLDALVAGCADLGLHRVE